MDLKLIQYLVEMQEEIEMNACDLASSVVCEVCGVDVPAL